MDTAGVGGPDPLRPVEIAANALVILLSAFFLMFAVLIPFGSASALGIGSEEVCTHSRPGIVDYVDSPTVSAVLADGTTVSDAGGSRVEHLRSDSNQSVDTLDLCVRRPGAGLRALAGLTTLPRMLLLIGFLVLVKLLIRRARRQGLFNNSVANSVRIIGWYVLLGSLIVATIEAVASAAMLDHMVPGAFGFGAIYDAWKVSIGVLVAGAGVITVAQVLHQAVALREDVDATI